MPSFRLHVLNFTLITYLCQLFLTKNYVFFKKLYFPPFQSNKRGWPINFIGLIYFLFFYFPFSYIFYFYLIFLTVLGVFFFFLLLFLVVFSFVNNYLCIILLYLSLIFFCLFLTFQHVLFYSIKKIRDHLILKQKKMFATTYFRLHYRRRFGA